MKYRFRDRVAGQIARVRSNARSAVREVRNRRAARFRTSFDISRALTFYSELIRPGDLCFDIGANVGDRTALFLSLGARVVAVEPQPGCVAILRERFAPDDVQVLAQGLGRRSGSAPLVVNRSNSGLSTMSERWRRDRFPEDAWAEPIEVPISTLDDLVKSFGLPAFCKIDVEGYEREVLAGLSSPLPMLSIEFTGIFLDDLKSNLAHLERLAPIEVNCVLYEQMRFALARWTDRAEVEGFLEGRAMKDEVLSGDVYVRQQNP